MEAPEDWGWAVEDTVASPCSVESITRGSQLPYKKGTTHNESYGKPRQRDPGPAEQLRPPAYSRMGVSS